MSSDSPTPCTQRYTGSAFPPYRFVPGRNPHPTGHPAGHSYLPPGRKPPPVAWVPPDRWSDSHDYLYATDLYNYGYWWEAHEAWEGLWQLTDKSGPQGLFLQGLIQVAACHLKLHVRQRPGVTRLLASSTDYLRRAMSLLDPTPVRYMGLDALGFVDRVIAYYAVRLDIQPLAHDDDAYPYIALELRSGGPPGPIA